MNITTANLINTNGNPAANQIATRIYGECEGAILNLNLFTSYNKRVCMIDYSGEETTIAIDSKAFDYSLTTSKYLNIFLEQNMINAKDIKKLYETKQDTRITNKYATSLVVFMDLNN